MIGYDPARHHRRSGRLRGYDYTRPGAYFVTLATPGREWLFGEVVAGEVVLSAYGLVAHEEWFRSAGIQREIDLFEEEFIVTPNHIHGIVWIVAANGEVDGAHGEPGGMHGKLEGAHGRAPLLPLYRPPKSLGSFIAGYKSAVTKRINQMRDRPGVPVWQRNYFERIVRNPRHLDAVQRYIRNNPGRWEVDRENRV